MAANPRFEVASSSPESTGFGYSVSHRTHFASGTNGPSLERSTSLRENHDGSGRVLTPGGSGQTFTSPSSSNSLGELLPMSQVLSLEVISSGEQKYARQLELRKATVAAMAIVGEVNGNLQQKPLEQQGVEELKRIRLSLLENATRARERSRGLLEAITKLDKYRASLQLRKRARAETLGVERPVTSGSGERPITATGASANSSKATFCASPSHTSISEGNMAKPDEKAKGGVPNKRMRTSMQDVRLENRVNTPNFQRSSSGIGDRERESIKLAVLPDEKDRLGQGSGEGWERMKTKGKRSATKSECVIAIGTSEIERDHKWGAQHRTNTDNRPRPSEGHSFRSGPVHGVVSIHKSSVRNESDSAVSVGDKGDRLGFPEKDRIMLKSGTKLQKDEGSLVIPTTVGKAKVARAPRTGTGISINPTGAHASRPHSAELWDRPAAASSAAAPNRTQIPLGPTNRKRPTPTRSSSPPVAQWVGQRSQKMARIARRINVAPPVAPTGVGKEEGMSVAAECDSIATPTGVRSNLSISPGSGFVKKVTCASALSQMKSKPDRAPSPAGLSESEDSEGGDVKSKEKWKKHGDAEARFAAINQKMAPLFSTGKKSRVSKEESGDGIRRQGRSGRTVIAVRESSTVTQVEKGDVAAANAKQLRNAKPGTEKPEKNSDVKPGRPPSKKGGIGDRKALTRPRRPAINGSEVSESDDDHEELVAAIQAAVNAGLHACSSVFWKEMEPFFAYLTHDARESLRIQVKAREFKEEEIFLGLFTSDSAVEKNPMYLNSSDAAKVTNLINGSEVNGVAVSMAFNNLKEEQVADVRSGGWINSKQLPLSQRLLSALIIEEDVDDAYKEELEPQGFGRDGSYHDPSDSEQAGLEKEQDSEPEVEIRKGDNGKLNGRSKISPYESSYMSNGHRHWDSESELQISPAKSERRKEEEEHPAGINDLKKWDGAYQDLKLDDRIALELQSIGLYPEPNEFVAREDDQIAEELKKSYIDLKEQIHTNKARLSSLEKVVSSSQEAEEREREQLAMRKLLENAFSKRLGNRGGLLGVSGSKSAASKAGRATALAMAKRGIARWKHFVETGESCFTEAGLREVLLCISSKDGETKAFPSCAEFRASINSVGLSLMGFLELKLAGSAGPRWICHAPGAHKADNDSSERSGEKKDVWCNRSKEREVLLEDVVASVGVGSVPCGSKGKRSERERDANHVKGSGRHGLTGTIKGERKTKTKPRQKTAPLLKAVNGLLAKPNESLEKSGMRVKPESSLLGSGVGVQLGEPTLDLTHLQIPGMDDLVVNGDLEGQGQDLGSWLDFDDPGLPDAGGDFMGLDVPMDDLADLAMMM